MQIVITASGGISDNFLNAGFSQPKNLVPFGDQTILTYVINQYNSLNIPITVTLKESECNVFKTDSFLSNLYPTIRPIVVPDGNRGALCSALLGLNPLKSGPVLIAPGDSVCIDVVTEILKDFRSNQVDAGTAIFKSDAKRWSYVRTDSHNKVIEIAEKKVISKYATTGLFYFRDVQTFIESATWALVNATNLNGQYYVSHSFHRLLAMEKNVIGYQLENSEAYASFSSPADLAQRLERI